MYLRRTTLATHTNPKARMNMKQSQDLALRKSRHHDLSIYPENNCLCMLTLLTLLTYLTLST